MAIPYLKEINGKLILMVNNSPFIAIAGEVHNSTSSDRVYMENAWAKAETLGMNTLLVPVTWELIEPEEGHFDFSIIDMLLETARKKQGHLVLLWFGAWKNAECMYAPVWVKKNLSRFRRAEIVKGENKSMIGKAPKSRQYTTLSYLCSDTLQADSKAFAAMMSYLKDQDEKVNTVIAVQVENETGILGTAREHSNQADKMYASLVPDDFVSYMKTHTSDMVPDVKRAVENGKFSGTWQEVFGDCSEEIFSAYNTASYVEKVAEAGKKIYDLPMTANCWLNDESINSAPGDYPSGGPVSRMCEVWDFCAPSIAYHCPDIYLRNFCDITDEYSRRKRTLFIPECATHSYCGPRMVYTIGHYHAACYAPFGFEDMGQPFTCRQGALFGMDVTDSALNIPQDVKEYGTLARMLSALMPYMTNQYGTDGLQAVCAERALTDNKISKMQLPKPDKTNMLCMDSYGILAIFDFPMLAAKDGVLLGVKIGEDEYMLIVMRAFLKFISLDPEKPHTDILSLEEQRVVDGKLVSGRRLNGDESAFLMINEPALLKVKLMNYQ